MNLLHSSKVLRAVSGTVLATSLIFQGMSPIMAVAAGNAPAPKTSMVFRGFQQAIPPAGTFQDAATLPTAITGYGPDACVPLLVKATNGSKKTGDVNLTLVYPYENGSQIGISDLEHITVTGGGDPQTAVDSLQDVTLTATSLVASNAAMLDTGASAAMTVNGPYKGGNTGKSPIKNEAGDRHYNIEVKAVPAGATAFILACARMSSDTDTIIDPYALITVKQGGQTDGQVYIQKTLSVPPPPPPPPPAAPTLTVTKIVVNDSGGVKLVEEFPLFVNATSVVSGQTNAFPPGNYVVSETLDPGYIGTISGDCNAFGNVTLQAGDSKHCTITNTDVAVGLTIITQVINDNGGTLLPSNFTTILQANADDPPSILVGNGSGITINLAVGPYGVGQVIQNGYELNFSGDCFGFINAGEMLTCVITNNDIPATVTVIKNVVNDGAGSLIPSDFTMQVAGDHASQSSFEGSPDGTVITLYPGTYSVDESAFVRLPGGGDSTTPHGYLKTLESTCSGTIALGQSVTCNITNDDPS